MNIRTHLYADRLWRKYKLGRDQLRLAKRQIIRFPLAPGLVAHYAAYRRTIKRRDWLKARERALALSQSAMKHQDRRMIQETMYALERLECWDDTARLRLVWRDLRPEQPANEWQGEDLAGKSLFVDFMDKEERGLGMSYRGVSLVGDVARRAQRIVLIVEPRLVPTFRRTLPDIEVVDPAGAPNAAEFDFSATMSVLAARAQIDGDGDYPAFVPLRPDPALTDRLRARYAEGGRLAVGIFWYSSHHGKQLPDLDDWGGFIAGRKANFVSLQYGEAVKDVSDFGAGRVLVDEAIDQMVDLDGFAAQVAALDAVIGISGTPCHLAGALGTPAAVLRDDWFRRQWPVMTDRVPWYPYLRIVGKNGRPWNEVLDEAWSEVCTLLGSRDEEGG